MPDHAPLLERAFAPVVEASYPVSRIEGEVPSFVRGSYYLNGPARFERGSLCYRHWLDGDGMVCALHFEDGRIHFTSRFVESKKWLDEEAAGGPVYRTFGTAFPGDRLRRGVATESPINVSVYPFGDTLLAFGENSLPWELDPVTLATRGPYTFDGQLNELSPFGAHPKLDAATGEFVNFGVSFSPKEPCLNLYCFRAGGAVRFRTRLGLPFPCSIHDFALSSRYAAFHVSPYLLDFRAFVHERRATLEALRWEPERGSRLLVADRATGREVASVPLGAGYCLHLVNCFEEGERLVVDVLEFERPLYGQYQIGSRFFEDVPAGGPVRYVVDVSRSALLSRLALAYRQAPDFPSVDPRRAALPYRDFWMLGMSAAGQPGRKLFDQLVHAVWDEGQPRDVYQAEPLCYLGGEPIVIPNPDVPDAGVVLCPVFDAEQATSAVAVFNAQAVSRGPVAVLRLEERIPLGFHASFREGPRLPAGNVGGRGLEPLP